jgi:hypothetical protein
MKQRWPELAEVSSLELSAKEYRRDEVVSADYS